MNCEHVKALCLEYLQNSLDRGDMLQIQAHIADCNVCFAELEATEHLLATLDSLPEEAPSPQMRERFYHMLEAYEQGTEATQKRRVAPGLFAWLRAAPAHGLFPLLAAAALVLLGVWLGKERTPEPVPEPSQYTAQQAEVHHMAQQVSLSLMRHESAGERLNGVRFSTRLSQAEPEVIDALLYTLTEDGNVNVRLAAVNALYRFRDDVRAREGLAEALVKEHSPMVQLALIECLSALEMKGGEAHLQELLKRGGINPMVRERARESLGGMY